MNISQEDIETLESLTDQDGARGAIARVLLAMIADDEPTEVTEE